MIQYVFERGTTAENLDQRVLNLEKALEELIEVRDDLQKEVDQAVSKGLTLSSQVKGWLARVDEAVDEVREIREEMDEKKQCMYCCRTKCLSRYKLGKRAGGEVERVNDLIPKGRGKLEVGLPDGLIASCPCCGDSEQSRLSKIREPSKRGACVDYWIVWDGGSRQDYFAQMHKQWLLELGS